MKIKIEKTPIQIRRRVAQKLESIKGTQMSPGANKATLGDMVCPIYRPDIDGVAYYEFEIINVKSTAAREHDGKSSKTGFILATNGRHDVPISHWSVTVEPPSNALVTKAGDKKISKIIKLDTLAYSAEDAAGNYITHIGTIPPRISGHENVKFEDLSGISTVIASPIKKTNDDKTKVELAAEKSGVKVPKLKLEAWQSYEQLKKEYSKMYKGHLQLLATGAEEYWKIEDLVEQFGEGVHEGTELAVPLLDAGKVNISGDGKKFIEVSPSKYSANVFMLKALPSDEKQEINFEVNISYNNGKRETLSYFIIPKGTPTNQKNNYPY
jgi:hypothetical protein